LPVDHTRLRVGGYFFLHASSAVFPLTAGFALFGWRAPLAVGIVIASTLAATALWRRIGQRGCQLHYAEMAWMALLLGMMLPADLAAHFSISSIGFWPILPAAGVALAIVYWLLGGMGASAVHPVVITFLLLLLLYGSAVSGHRALQRDSTFSGDLADTGPPAPVVLSHEPWYRRPIVPNHPAVMSTPAAETLASYTTGQTSPDRAWLSLEGLLRDRLPPLEDVILGAQPGPIGAGSAIAVIIGGLLLIYRQLIDFRVPLLMVLTAFVMLVMLPVPAVITDHPQWHWVVGHAVGIGWPVGITLASYEILSTPLLFTAFFLAGAPSVRPLTGRGRTIYAVCAGALAGALQLYVSAAVGSYLALLAAGVLTPMLDRWVKPKRLV
jgi:Na+-translocating ferredoxin:NAD+ oxidoreductase RnfD subunit